MAAVQGFPAGAPLLLPDLELVAGLLSKAAERVSSILADTSEACVSDGIEASLQGAAALLDRLAESLPAGDAECEVLAEAVAAAAGCRGVATEPGSSVSQEEALFAFRALAGLLLDLRASLQGISKEEIRELVAVGLPLAQAAAATAHKGLAGTQLRLQGSTCASSNTVVIEDLSEENEGNLLPEAPAEELSIRLLPPRRYLWKPLWPRICKAWPRFRHWSVESGARAFVAERPLLSASAALAASPVAFCGAYWASVILLTDAALQRAYAWRGPEAEDALEGALKAANLSYLTARLLARHSLRAVQRHAERVLDGRRPADLVRDAAGELRRDPWGCAQTTAGKAVSAARWAGCRLTEVPRWASSARQAVAAAWPR